MQKWNGKTEAHQTTSDENEEIVHVNERENDKVDDKDGQEDHYDIVIECDVDLNYAGANEEQLVILSKIGYTGLCDQTDSEQEFYGF